MLWPHPIVVHILGRVWNQSSNKQKVNSFEDALQTLQENLQKGVEISEVMINRDARVILQSARKDEVLKGQSTGITI